MPARAGLEAVLSILNTGVQCPRKAAGPTRRHNGVTLLTIVDRHGFPLSMRTQAANHHEVTLVHVRFDFCTLEAAPEHLIEDRASDSDGPMTPSRKTVST